MVRKGKKRRPTSVTQCNASSEKAPLKLDLGCGKNKKEGFFGVDVEKFPGVDMVFDLTNPWPWEDESVDEIHCSHFIEHFDSVDRAHIVNEAYRVLKPGGKMTLIAPHCFSERAYGDPSHKWPPVSSFWFFYLNKEWRDREAPHTNKFYKCNFRVTWGYSLNPGLEARNQETQSFAVTWYVNSIMDIHATMTKV